MCHNKVNSKTYIHKSPKLCLILSCSCHSFPFECVQNTLAQRTKFVSVNTSEICCFLKFWYSKSYGINVKKSEMANFFCAGRNFVSFVLDCGAQRMEPIKSRPKNRSCVRIFRLKPIECKFWFR
jgi:hypothetical protein